MPQYSGLRSVQADAAGVFPAEDGDRFRRKLAQQFDALPVLLRDERIPGDVLAVGGVIEFGQADAALFI